MPQNSRKALNSQSTQLSISFNAKPFLETRKKVRGRNRTAFDKIQEGALELQYALQRNEIQSSEARVEIRELLRALGLN
jgi:hypothetical protein